VSRTAARRDALRATAAERGLDAVLVTNLLNVRYLTGFTGSNGALLVRTDGPDLLATDGRYTTQAAAQVPDVEVLVDRATVAGLARAAVQRGIGRLGYESHDLTVDGLAALEQMLAEGGGTVPELASIQRAVESQRAIKDDDEIEALRRACAIADRALAELAAQGALRPGRTELQVGRELDARMLELGAEAVSFETIVATGANSAIPHHRPDATVLQDGDFLKLDFGATVDGYHSDMTRTGSRRSTTWSRRRRRPGVPRSRWVPTSSRSTRRAARSSPTPATATTFPTVSGTVWGSRSTRRPASGRWARVPWPLAWPSRWSRGCTSRATAVSGSRTP
jgi:Xaa-Pro aminopeptidase